MTENGIILNNEMADFSIPGVTKVGWDGPPKVSQNVCYILCIIPPSPREMMAIPKVIILIKIS